MSNLLETVKKHIVGITIAVVVLGGAGLYVGIKIADQPFFCAMMCHEMQPHLDTYRANFHSKAGVTCMDCHAPHQSFFGHTMEHIEASVFMIPHVTKPYLEDEEHLHKNIKDFKAEEMSFKDVEPGSAKEKELFEKCKTCHPNRLPTSYYMHVPHEKVSLVPNINCRRCHPKIVEQAETNVEKAKAALYLPKENGKPRNLPNPHPLHLGKNILCTSCHSRVVHSTKPDRHTPGMEYCFRCHDDQKAPRSKCELCHVGIQNIRQAKDAKNFTGDPSPMADLSCTDCHTKENLKVDTAACTGCHDDSYPGKLAEFQKEFDQKVKELDALYAAAQAKIKKAERSGKDLTALIKEYRTAEFNLAYIKLDLSRGLHNHDFTNNLIADTQTKFEMVQSTL